MISAAVAALDQTDLEVQVAEMSTLLRGALVFLVMVIAVTGAQHLHKARTYQPFGELVPRVERTRKVIALTFDDGPTAGYGDQILDLLRQLNIRATFFVNGRDVEAQAELVSRMAAEGHELGNHTYSHARMVLKSGYTGPIHFRPPYGKKLVILPHYLWKTGRKTIM